MGKQLTKRQRKALRGPNYAMKQSLKNGSSHVVNGTEYRGDNPVYQQQPYGGLVKVRAGVPFVRA